MQVSNDFDMVEQERASSMSAQVGSTNILGEVPDVSDGFKRYLTKA